MKAIKLSINQKYREGMSPEELYEISRGDWKVGEESRQTAEYALAVANDTTPDDAGKKRPKVRALYKIHKWEQVQNDRWRFDGNAIDGELWEKCKGKKQARRTVQNPVGIIDLLVFSQFAHGIEKPHVENALTYIAEKCKSESNGILHVSKNKKPLTKYVLHHGKKCGVKDIIRIAYCYSISEQPNEPNKEFSQKQCDLFDNTSARWNTNIATKLLDGWGFKVSHEDSKAQNGEGNMKATELIKLLKQFNQIILYGPPGTGKTYAAKQIIQELFGAANGKNWQGTRWDIVQFHPSYNYEDFVRGIQVETNPKNEVTYKTTNRTFGIMCKNACKAPVEEPYVLIIDEINRANVSAVLGELIYALEYRGKKIRTPYSDELPHLDQNFPHNLIIPKNLYIIGTMNTADRTIGQIDYAIRRRFAFVHCKPDEKVISDSEAKELFVLVNEIFDEHLSPDFNAADVRIGHTYFITTEKETSKELGNRIIYQVIPILQEYVKDSVLQESATDAIDEIWEIAKQLIDDGSKSPNPPQSFPYDDSSEVSGHYFRWENGKRFGLGNTGRLMFGIIKDYVEQNHTITAEDLMEKFNFLTLNKRKPIELLRNISGKEELYFSDHSDQIPLKNADVVLVSNQWLVSNYSDTWRDILESMKLLGYSIVQYRIVSTNENGQRDWKYWNKYNFVSAGEDTACLRQIEGLRQGDLLFVCRTGNKTTQRNCIAYCKVESEQAIEVENIETQKGELLGDIQVDNGKTYREEFCNGRNIPDKAVVVEWIKILDKPVEVKGSHGGFRVNTIKKQDFRRLADAFSIPRPDAKT